MARESQTTREQRIHAEAMTEFDEVQEAQADERRQCVEDRRFASIAGAQWEGPLSDQLKGRPQMEFNKVQSACVRIINEMRNANIGIRFSPRDPEAELDDDLADLCAGKLRADEYDSSADEAYGNGSEEAITGGFGAWQLRADLIDPDDEADERQRICFEPIYDADSSVYFDLGAKEQDKSDAKRCWVIKSMTPAAYKAEFSRDPASWPKDVTSTQFDWSTPDIVYVCEYYRIEKRKQAVQVWNGPTGEERELSAEDYDEDEDFAAELERMFALGWRLKAKKKREFREVHKWILDGGGIIEDCGVIAGKYIPVIPVVGKRWFVDNIERYAGAVRYVKDSQRLKNMQLSKLAEIAALSSREKPIFTAEQIAGHEIAWAQDNLRDYPYLTINGVDENGQPLPIGPQSYTKPPTIPPALAALIGQTETEIREILGSPEQAEKLLSGVSGEAVSLVQQRVDGMSAIYLTNYAKAKRHTARVWLSMAADVYVEEGRNVRVMSEDGEADFKKINAPKQGANGELLEGLTFERAKFDIYADVGPNSQSARQATVRAVSSMMQMTQDPEDLKILLSVALMNMDGEGVGDVRKYYRKRLVRMGVQTPTEAEQQEMAQAAQNAKPDPQAAFLEAESQKSLALAQKAAADTRKSVAETAKTEAETVEIVHGLRGGQGQMK